MMKRDVKEVIEIIESDKRVLNAVIKAVENSTDLEDLEDQDRLLTRYKERVRQCNILILAFNTLLENKEVQ